MPDERPQPQERVAVIVVHGVADQPPRSSVRQVASLLANVDDGGVPAYGPFTAQALHVPVRRLPPSPQAPLGAFFHASQAAGATPIDHVLTDSMLAEYEGEGPNATFETLRLSTARATAGGERPVDVFELYWADLSRVGTAAWRILGELYQVLLHVGSLGKHAASASVAGDGRPSAKAFHWTTAAASLMLAGPIAIFNAYLLVSAALVLASLLPLPAHVPISVAIGAVAVLAPFATALLLSSRAQLALRIGGLTVAVVLAAAALVVGVSMGVLRFDATRLLAAEVLVLALGGVGLVLRAYLRRRPQTAAFSVAGALVVVFVGAVALAANRDITGGDERFALLAVPGFRIAEMLYFVLYWAWAGFLLLLWASLAAGSAYWRGITDPVRRGAARRAVWTARVAVVIPAAAFLLLTIALWSGLHTALGRSFDGSYVVLDYVAELLPGVTTGGTFIERLLVSSLGPAFVPAAVLMTLAALMVLVSVAPILWTELFPPATNRLSAHFGAWLTSTFSVLRGAAGLTVLAFIVWPLLALGERVVMRLPWEQEAAALVGWLGLAVAVPATGLLAFRGSLQKLAAGFRGPVDVLLDVDGYLREHPRSQAPRARVFARYYSLLLHIAAASPAYTKIVVIAHSQGTVITTDLFRYLNFRQLWPFAVPVRLFTMGSPLRQLYARRFPELYDWVWHDAPPAAAPIVLPDIGASCKPDPAALGVAAWVNAYRSGDYVGRWLWRPDVCAYQFDASDVRAPWSSISAPLPGHSHDPAHTRREICVGAGAHTHYWDGTAPEIAVELDFLIRQ